MKIRAIICLLASLTMPTTLVGTRPASGIEFTSDEDIVEASHFDHFGHVDRITEAGEEVKQARKFAEMQEEARLEKQRVEHEAYLATLQRTEVNFTSYAPGMTSNGTSPANFTYNEYDMAVDSEGYIVLAGATQICLDIKTGPCGDYNYLPSGYRIFDLGDVVTFTIYADKYAGRVFTGKIHDSCGACFWAESHQRVDIMMAGSLGKIRGTAEIQ